MSRISRLVLSAILGVFVWMTLSGWSVDSGPERVSSGIFAGFIILIIFALLFPGWSKIPLRVVAGIVAATCISYFVVELVGLMRGEPQPLRLGEPSTFMAGVALLLFGIPALMFALGGEVVGWIRSVFGKSDSERPGQDGTV